MSPTNQTAAMGKSLPPAASYTPLMEDILGDIAAGRLQPGDRLASEVQLRSRYDLGIATIKRGLDELARRGVLERRRGSGTYVATPTERPHEPVSRDTVAILRSWERRGYHPYFSEVERGIRAGLARRGWRALELTPWGERPWSPGEEMAYRLINPHAVAHELAAHSETVGLIALEGSESRLAELDLGLPLVCTIPDQGLPWVAYDWDREIRRLFELALAEQPARVAVFGSRREADLHRQLAAALRGLAIDPAAVHTEIHPVPESKRWSELMASAYDTAVAVFAAATEPFDAIVVTSDCEAQGVADALARQPTASWQRTRFYVRCNQASQLQIPFPYTSLVADGYRFGESLVDLLHGHLTAPHTAPSHLRLACDERAHTHLR